MQMLVNLLCPLSRYRFNPLRSGFPHRLELFDFRIFELGHEYAAGDYPMLTNPRPPFDDFIIIRKVVVTLLDGGPHFLLLGIFDEGYLALYKSVDRRWSAIREKSYPYSDVIAYNENLYAVEKTGITGRLELMANANPILKGLDKKLVQSTRGKLLLVDLYMRTDYGDEALLESPILVLDDWIKEFWNYTAYQSARVDELDEESQSWIAVTCLVDQVLFSGQDSIFSASASDLSGCRGNCIFFLDSFGNDENSKEESGAYVYKNIGVFDLGTGSMGRLSSYPEYAKIF